MNTIYTDAEKVERLEHALRTERDHLRHNVGDKTAANAINSYLQTADTDSKLRFANLLLEA